MALLNPYDLMSGNGAANLNTTSYTPNSNGVYNLSFGDVGATNNVYSQPQQQTTTQPQTQTTSNPYQIQSQPSYTNSYTAPQTTTPQPQYTQPQYNTGLVSPTSPYTNTNISSPTATAPNGQTYGLNPTYWATADFAKQIAQQYGGTVIPTNPLGGNFSANQPQYMIKRDDGSIINPADIADLYNHGYGASKIADGLKTILTGQPTLYQNSLATLTNPNDFMMSNGNVVAKNYYGPGSGPMGGATQGGPVIMPYTIPGQNLFAPQQNANPFGDLVSQLYGQNPFNAAFGSAGQLLANASSGSNLNGIAQLLNSIFAMRQQPAGSGVMSPLFWGSQQQQQSQRNPNYFPSFY